MHEQLLSNPDDSHRPHSPPEQSAIGWFEDTDGQALNSEWDLIRGQDNLSPCSLALTPVEYPFQLPFQQAESSANMDCSANSPVGTTTATTVGPPLFTLTIPGLDPDPGHASIANGLADVFSPNSTPSALRFSFASASYPQADAPVALDTAEGSNLLPGFGPDGLPLGPLKLSYHGEPFYVCQIVNDAEDFMCGTICENQRTYYRHFEQQHAPRPILTCPYDHPRRRCPATFDRHADLTEHIGEMHMKPVFRCPYPAIHVRCRYDYRTENYLARHIAAYHPDKVEEWKQMG